MGYITINLNEWFFEFKECISGESCMGFRILEESNAQVRVEQQKSHVYPRRVKCARLMKTVLLSESDILARIEKQFP